MRKIIRKRKHINYLRENISDLHWEIINTAVQSTKVGWTERTTKYVVNCAKLIRKYERRLNLIKL